MLKITVDLTKPSKEELVAFQHFLTQYSKLAVETSAEDIIAKKETHIADQTASGEPDSPKKKKRTRRTKAQIEADREAKKAQIDKEAQTDPMAEEKIPDLAKGGLAIEGSKTSLGGELEPEHIAPLDKIKKAVAPKSEGTTAKDVKDFAAKIEEENKAKAAKAKAKSFTLDDVRLKMSEVLKADRTKKSDIKVEMGLLGANKVSEIAEEDYQKFIDFLESL